MADKYPLIINGKDFTDMVEQDSYNTGIQVVYSEAITTMNGVDHMVKLRDRGIWSGKFNPQTDTGTARLCAALMSCPATVQYHCLQRNKTVTAQMVIEEISAGYLSRVLYGQKKWNEIGAVTLKEL